MIKAICAQQMNWFGSAHHLLFGVGERSGSAFVKFVCFLLCIPCFKAHYFFFKIVYTINQRKLISLGVDSALLSRGDYLVELDRLLHKDTSIADANKGLRHLRSRLQ